MFTRSNTITIAATLAIAATTTTLAGGPDVDCDIAPNNGLSLHFPADDAWVDCGTSPSLQIKGNLTIEAWIRPDVLKNQVIISHNAPNDGSSATNSLYNLQLRDDGSVRVRHHSGDNVAQVVDFDDANIQAGVWQHIALVRIDLFDTYALVVDGVAVGSETYDADPTDGSAGYLVLGISPAFDNNDFEGDMDEVRVWNTIRSVDDIREYRFHYLQDAPAGLVANYRLNDNAPMASDRIGGADGTIVGATWRDISIGGQNNGVIQLRAPEAYVYAASPSDTRIGGDVTVEGWIRPYVMAEQNFVASHRDGAGASFNDQYVLRLLENGDIRVTHEYDNGIDQSFDFDADYEVGVWQHIALVRDNAAMTYTLYKNGAMVGAQAIANLPTGGSACHFLLGYGPENAPTYYKGQMDELRIWDVARSQADIQATMRAALDGSETGLVSYWPCGNGFGWDAQVGSAHLWSAGDATLPAVLPDANCDGTLDTCEHEPCVADIDGSGEVDVADMLILLGDYGCPECPQSDFNGDNMTDVADLLILLGAWGPC